MLRAFAVMIKVILNSFLLWKAEDLALTQLNSVLNSNHKITSAWLRNIQDEEVDDDRGRKFYYFIFEILAREPILCIIFLMAFYIEKIFFL